MKFKENVSLAKFSNYKIGGVARYFFEPKSEKEVAWAVRTAKEQKLAIFILGGGTNLLLSDLGFYGLVLKPAMAAIKQAKIKKEKGATMIEVGAGASMAQLLDYSIAKSLSGLEWAGGLPGTIGGAVRGNAGCFGGEMKDVVFAVRSFDIKKMKVVERNTKACAFKYRESTFKKNSEIILSVQLRMEAGDKKMIAQSIKEKIEYRKKNHPLEYPNVGSIFKNVALAGMYQEGSRQYQAALTRQELQFRGSQFSVKTDPFPVISAAKLISESGLRGVSMGGAMISGKHPNFIVNALDARAEDVKSLMALAKAEVKRKFGIALEEEVQIV